ncbi:MAG: VOC family protein [Dongiaceae bacterium]
MIRGVHHTSLSTNNYDRMVHFYRDLLGLEVASELGWEAGTGPADKVVGLENTAVKCVLLRAGNMFIEIFEYLQPRGKPGDPARRACDSGLTHICFDVVDVDHEYRRLLAAGIEFNTPPVDVHGLLRTTYGRDPDGNYFELQEIFPTDHALSFERLSEPRKG